MDENVNHGREINPAWIQNDAAQELGQETFTHLLNLRCRVLQNCEQPVQNIRQECQQIQVRH